MQSGIPFRKTRERMGHRQQWNCPTQAKTRLECATRPLAERHPGFVAAAHRLHRAECQPPKACRIMCVDRYGQVAGSELYACLLHRYLTSFVIIIAVIQSEGVANAVSDR
jgi:hypothetical protein